MYILYLEIYHESGFSWKLYKVFLLWFVQFLIALWILIGSSTWFEWWWQLCRHRVVVIAVFVTLILFFCKDESLMFRIWMGFIDWDLTVRISVILFQLILFYFYFLFFYMTEGWFWWNLSNVLFFYFLFYQLLCLLSHDNSLFSGHLNSLIQTVCFIRWN